MQVSFEAQTQMFEDQIAALEAREAELVPFLQGCLVGSRAQGTVCGLRVNEAPDPWLSADGRPCRGYSTRSTLEYEFCGYWTSPENPEAADDDTRLELLKVGPFCLDTEGSVLFCSSEAKRTQRSGIYELRHLARDDRAYCASRFVRERLTPEVHNESGCRAELQHRLELCGLECDVCKAECTSPAARDLVSTWKCIAGMPVLGLMTAFHESDIGQDISYRWSAKRTEGRPSNPNDAFQEQYRTLIQQPRIDQPIAPRNCKLLLFKPHILYRISARAACPQQFPVVALTVKAPTVATFPHSKTTERRSNERGSWCRAKRCVASLCPTVYTGD